MLYDTFPRTYTLLPVIPRTSFIPRSVFSFHLLFIPVYQCYSVHINPSIVRLFLPLSPTYHFHTFFFQYLCIVVACFIYQLYLNIVVVFSYLLLLLLRFFFHFPCRFERERKQGEMVYTQIKYKRESWRKTQQIIRLNKCTVDNYSLIQIIVRRATWNENVKKKIK